MKSKLGKWSTGGKAVEQGGKAMPAVSKKQKNFMDAAAHNPSFAKEAGVPFKVAKEFSKSSKGMKFKKGEDMKKSKDMMEKEVAFMKKKGAPKSMIKHEKAEAKMGEMGYKAGGSVKFRSAADGIAHKGKTKGAQVKMAAGGMAKKYC